MCTLSVVRGGSDAFGAVDEPMLRVMMNRDEQRTRPESTPPEFRRIDGVNVLMPTDPVSGGTWIAVNEHGLVLALLNANPGTSTYAGARGAAYAGRRSRGEIIPFLASSKDADAAIERIGTLRASDFPPFTLVAVDAARVGLARGDGSALAIEPCRELEMAAVWASSGLGDDLVIGPRTEAFRRNVASHTSVSAAFAAQEAFHWHAWAHAPEIGVLMCREDARTVSRTTVEICLDRARMRYEPLGDDVRPNGNESVRQIAIAPSRAGART